MAHPEFHFCFGPQPGGYIVAWPGRWEMGHNIHQAMLDLMYSFESDIGHLRWAAMGDDCYAAWLFTHSKGIRMQVSPAFELNLPGAYAFLLKMLLRHRQRNMSVAMGPGSAIVISAPGRDQVYTHHLDPFVEAKIFKFDNVRHVALGVGGAHVIFHSDGIDWDLRGYYDTLESILKQQNSESPDGLRSVEYVALNPWRAGEFVLVKKDRSVHFEVFHSVADELKGILEDYKNFSPPNGPEQPRTRAPQTASQASNAADTPAPPPPALP